MSERLEAALGYAGQGWPIFPCDWQGPNRKRPLTEHGYKDATADPAIVTRWWTRWPGALIGTPTGRAFVVLDVDTRHGGFETMTALAFPTLPATPTVRTAGGGVHIYFAPLPGIEVGNTQGARGRGIGAGLDWRGTGGYVIFPVPGSGYEWVAETLALPLAPIPSALLPREAGGSSESAGTAAAREDLSPYGEAALRSATKKILDAPNGEQEATLNGESYAIGRLAGGGVPPELALDVLLTAARAIPSYDAGRPWRPAEIEAKVRRAFAQGMVKPRPEWAEVEREFDRAIREAAEALDAASNEAEAAIDAKLVAARPNGEDRSEPKLLSFGEMLEPDLSRKGLVKGIIDGRTIVLTHGELAAEAGPSIGNRVAAWARERWDERNAIDFAAVVSPVDLCHLKDKENLKRLGQLVAAIGTADVVIIDTVSRALAGGDENSPDNMGVFVSALDRLRARLGLRGHRDPPRRQGRERRCAGPLVAQVRRRHRDLG